MKLKNKTITYYPVKTKKGFKVCRTNEPHKSLGFATFRIKKVAVAMGKRWYGGIQEQCNICGRVN